MNSANETVQAGLAAFARATEERDFYKAEFDRLTVSVARLEGENETLRAQLDKTQNQLNNALHHAAELKTHMYNGIDLFRRALDRSAATSLTDREEPRLPAAGPTEKAMGLAALANGRDKQDGNVQNLDKLAAELEENGRGVTLHRDSQARDLDERASGVR
jgi:uncharacterized membrane-anchored protein YhcB (DUF1043 family)